MRRAGPRLLATARRLLRDEEQARAAVAEVFAAPPIAPFGMPLATWLLRRVATTACRRIRDRGHASADSIDAFTPRFDATGHWVDAVRPFPLRCDDRTPLAGSTALARALDRLPEPVRAIVVLRDVERIDDEAVAELLCATAAQVRSELHRGRHALRALVAHELATDDTRDQTHPASPA